MYLMIWEAHRALRYSSVVYAISTGLISALNSSCSGASNITGWFLFLSSLTSHFPWYFGSFSILQCTSWGLIQDRIYLKISSGSFSIVFSIHCSANCLRKSKVGIILLPFWKCPYASAVSTYLTSRYHGNVQQKTWQLILRGRNFYHCRSIILCNMKRLQFNCKKKQERKGAVQQVFYALTLSF